MSHISNLRLLFSSSSTSSFLSPLKPSFKFSLLSNPRFLSPLTILSSSSYKKHRNNNNPQNLNRRNSSTLIENKGVLMEESDSVVGFNKRRAEGRDKNDRPKNLQLKVRKLNPVNTICYVQILGTGMDTQDTSPSILLFFDRQRFIFNAGEGLQRFCTEHKIKLSKIDHIFLSRVCSETAGGLPGLLLTLAGMGDEGMSVNIWGPSDFKYLVDAIKSFIPKAAVVHTRSFGPPPSSEEVSIPDPWKFRDPIVLIDDEVVKLSAILLRPSCTSGSQVDQETLLLPPPKKKAVSVIKPGDLSVIYVCELPEVKGKFDPKKAIALGLRPGPKYRDLQLGNPVLSDCQNIMVHPSDVMEPSLPGPVVLVVDCPTESHLEELISLQSFSCYYAESAINAQVGSKSVNCVIHLSPGSVTRNPNYQNWMNRFGATQHVMAGHERKNVEIPILKSSARIAARLNYLCPQFFPAPGFRTIQDFSNSAPDSLASSEVHMLCQRISAQNLLKFTLRPYTQLGLDTSCIPSLTSPSEVIDELHSEIPEIVDAAQQVSQFWHTNGEAKEDAAPVQDNGVIIEEPWLDESVLPNCLENIRRDDMEIVLLGTGSSQPSKYRNVTSIFINLFSRGSLLLDCGEGTLGQLKRRYGVEGADDAVKALRCIWISHIHADHHTGLARILALRRELLKEVPHEPLLVIGPRQLKRFLDAYQRLEDLDMVFLNCAETIEPSELKDESTNHLFAKGSRMQSHWKMPKSPSQNNIITSILNNMKKVLSEAGLEGLVSFPVVHCPEAFGVSIKAAERVNSVGKVVPGWKIVYSGDTRPCPQLIEAARGATVLIHEATFEDAMVDEAIVRNHSTTKEAIEMGDAAGAYRIILTHFSQRYPKIPVFDKTHMHKTCIAFDMMSVNIADLPVLPKVLPYLTLLFKNEMIVDESDDVVTDIIAFSEV